MPEADDLNPVLKAREERRQERLKSMRQSRAVPRVRVTPTSDNIRKYIKHPLGGIGFPAEGSVEWPLDQFTQRRIRDGDVTIEEARPQHGRASEHRQHTRPHAE